MNRQDGTIHVTGHLYTAAQGTTRKTVELTIEIRRTRGTVTAIKCDGPTPDGLMEAETRMPKFENGSTLTFRGTMTQQEDAGKSRTFTVEVQSFNRPRQNVSAELEPETPP